MTNASRQPVTRRAVLSGVVAAGGATALGGALVACGGPGTPDPSSDSDAPTTVKVADIPVGGGAIVAGAQVVVAQPTAGQFTAFSAVCTHQGCVVAKVENGTIHCTCHNSSFSTSDGSVITGPATRPLPSRSVTVSGDTLTIS